MSEEITPSPPILNYATLASDGLPEWVPEAEALIEAGKPPVAIKKFFHKIEDAVKYYAKSLTRRYGLATVGYHCVGCARDAKDYAVKVGWWVDVWAWYSEHGTRAGRRLVASAEAFTTHAICPNCYKAWKRRVRREVMGVFFVASFLAVLVVIAAGIAIFKGPKNAVEVSGVIGGVMVVLAVLMFCMSALLKVTAFRQYPQRLKLLFHPDIRYSGQFELIRRRNEQASP